MNHKSLITLLYLRRWTALDYTVSAREHISRPAYWQWAYVKFYDIIAGYATFRI